MSCIQKKRYGELDIIREGRQFCWNIRDFLQLIQNGNNSNSDTPQRYMVLDSQKRKSFEGIPFHLRIVIDDGHVGFYIHYKHHTIPKYSFSFESSTRSGDSGSSNEFRTKLCQSTANSIPSKSSRCGHRAVISIADILAKIPTAGRSTTGQQIARVDSNLCVYFCFDEDYVEDQTTGTYVWHIHHLSKIQSSELYSSIIVTNFGRNAASVFFMICLDHRVDFRVAHKDNIPQFGFAFINTKNEVIFRSSTSIEPPLKEIVLRSVAHDDILLVRLIFFINPLNQISANPAAAAVTSGSHESLSRNDSLNSQRSNSYRRRSQERQPSRGNVSDSPVVNEPELERRGSGGSTLNYAANRLIPANLIDASQCHIRGVPDLEPLDGLPNPVVSNDMLDPIPDVLPKDTRQDGTGTSSNELNNKPTNSGAHLEHPTTTSSVYRSTPEPSSIP